MIFRSASMFFQSGADRAAAVERLFDTQAMRDFMEHRVAEEGIKGDVFALLVSNQLVGNPQKYLVELGTHGILQLQSPSSFLQLHLFVVRQVDGDCLRTGVAVASIVNHVVRIQFSVGARLLLLVLIGDRQCRLKCREEFRILGQTEIGRASCRGRV